MSSGKHLSAGSPKPNLPDDGLLRLYSMRFCPYAHRVHLILDAKKIPFHSIFINLQNKPEWLAQVSATSKVPALELDKETGQLTLIESLIICDYLDEKYPDRPLYPKDPLKKAQDRILIERFGAFINAYYKLLLNDKFKELCIKDLYAGLDIYENELNARCSSFFSGEQPGMLDYMIWPWCERFPALKYQVDDQIEYDPARFEKLIKWRDLMLADTSVKGFYLDCETHVKYISSKRSGEPDYDMLTKPTEG